LASNGVSPTSIQENEGVNMLRKVKSNFLQRYQPAEKIRAYEARILSSSIQKSTLPLIVIGDFNDPPSSYVYHTIRGSLLDAFTSCGWGWGSTYSGPIPFLRIDNIFCSDPIKPTSFEILPTNISDHHPIKATFILR
jgi:endonuclease/exonuclease/phosphatase (EEP) superfamily protein YafD